MNKEFDFEKTGKTTPYKVPPTFFADSEEKIKARIRAEKPQRKRQPLRFVAPALAVAAVITVVLIFSLFREADTADRETVIPGIYASAALQMEMIGGSDTDTPNEMDQLIENLSDEELTELITQVNGDVFLF